MSADELLSRLQKVRPTGKGKWMARCSAHQDGRPSLAIREESDGRVLLHCFAGCAVEDILTAVDLDFDALFPEKPIEHAGAIRQPFNARDVLAACADEIQLAAIVALRMKDGKAVTPGDRERLMVAHDRLQQAVRMIDG